MGTPLRDVPRESRSCIAAQVIHLPFHFATLVFTSAQLQQEPQANLTRALYLNSLHKGRKSPGMMPVKNIDSPMLREWFGNLDGHVLSIPAIEQPAGHSCGMAANINAAIALYLGTYEEIVDSGFSKALAKLNLPAANRWSNDDFVAATQVLIKHYEHGIDSIPSLADVFAEMSVEIAKLRECLEHKRLDAQNRITAQRTTGKQSTLIGFLAKAKKNSHPSSKSG